MNQPTSSPSTQALEAFHGIDAYTLGDAARRAGTGAVLHLFKPVAGPSHFVGRALTARIQYEPHRQIPLKDYGGAQLREQAGPGDVVVLDGSGLMLSAMGEIAFADLQARGAAAALVYGCVRDVEQHRELGLVLPVFAAGVALASVAGNARIVEVGQPIYPGGVRIATGDLIAGCSGGVAVVPWDDREAVLEQAHRITESDRLVREGLRRGESSARLWEQHKAF